MSDRTVHEVQQGETHRLRIASPLGSVFTATCVAALHRLPGGINSSTPDPEEAATYTVTEFSGDSDYGDGFDFELAAADTADLAPGTYIAGPLISYSAPETFVDAPLAWIVQIKAYPS